MLKQSDGGTLVALCDGCGAIVDTGMRSKKDAGLYLSRAEGWENVPPKRGKQDWGNLCPSCIEGGEIDPDLDRAGISFTRHRIDDD
jgi:hypothetical protein